MYTPSTFRLSPTTRSNRAKFCSRFASSAAVQDQNHHVAKVQVRSQPVLLIQLVGVQDQPDIEPRRAGVEPVPQLTQRRAGDFFSGRHLYPVIVEDNASEVRQRLREGEDGIDIAFVFDGPDDLLHRGEGSGVCLERGLWFAFVADEEDVGDAEVGGGFGRRDGRVADDAVLVGAAGVRAGRMAPEPKSAADGRGHGKTELSGGSTTSIRAVVATFHQFPWRFGGSSMRSGGRKSGALTRHGRACRSPTQPFSSS